MFVNRTTELARLERWWAADSARLAMVWGRRRVGKTSLIRHFTQDKPAVFHTGALRGRPGELAVVSQAVAAFGESRGTRDVIERPFREWDGVLDYVAELARDRPVLLILDEFPEITVASPELPHVLRAFIDRAVGQTQLRILIAGSAVRHMRALGEERQPLYGRLDLSLQLHPFEPWEAALLLPSLPASERAAVYGILGGIPLYLNWWDQNGSIAENLTVLAGEPGGRLLTEGDLVLATEVDDGEYPAAVLYAVASGRTKHNEIKDAIGADPSRTLDRLVGLRLLERVQPVTETGRTRRRIYRVADNFLAFHLGLLGKFRNDIEGGLGAGIISVVMDCLDDHLGLSWEAAFRAHLRRLAVEGALGEQIVAIGPWWDQVGGSEIDAVALSGRSRTPVAVGEATWGKRVDGGRLAAQLRRKAEILPGVVDDPKIILAARERIDRAPDDAMTITAEDVFT